jgi:hypothetical protein
MIWAASFLYFTFLSFLGSVRCLKADTGYLFGRWSRGALFSYLSYRRRPGRSYTVGFGLVPIFGHAVSFVLDLRRLTNEGQMTSDNTNIGAKFVFS